RRPLVAKSRVVPRINEAPNCEYVRPGNGVSLEITTGSSTMQEHYCGHVFCPRGLCRALNFRRASLFPSRVSSHWFAGSGRAWLPTATRSPRPGGRGTILRHRQVGHFSVSVRRAVATGNVRPKDVCSGRRAHRNGGDLHGAAGRNVWLVLSATR